MPFHRLPPLLSRQNDFSVFRHHLISCSNASNSGVEKNSPKVISSPSQSFLMVRMEMSRLRSSNMLYTVEGVTPELVAS